MHKYLNNMDELNIYANMPDQHLINIMLNGMTPRLPQATAHNNAVLSDLYKVKEKRLYIDFITTKLKNKEKDNKSKC